MGLVTGIIVEFGIGVEKRCAKERGTNGPSKKYSAFILQKKPIRMLSL